MKWWDDWRRHREWKQYNKKSAHLCWRACEVLYREGHREAAERLRQNIVHRLDLAVARNDGQNWVKDCLDMAKAEIERTMTLDTTTQ
jgi:protoporphyrinogen oxidase